MAKPKIDPISEKILFGNPPLLFDCPLLTGCELSGVFDDAVSRLEHALDLAALRALRKPGVHTLWFITAPVKLV